MVLPGIPTVYAGDVQGFTGKAADQHLISLRRAHAWMARADLAPPVSG